VLTDRSVLIIGGGITGITAALELADMGVPSTLVERESRVGGQASTFACKATEACNQCFACVVDDQIQELHGASRISVMTGSTLEKLTGKPGRFKAQIRSNDRETTHPAAAVLVATGVDFFDASDKPEYGYELLQNVITSRDLNEILRAKARICRPSDGEVPSKIAFLQCIGSRDETIGHSWCSKVCCASALRLMRSIRYQNPEIQATFFYIDIQPLGRSFESVLQTCRDDEGTRLIRSLPSKVCGTQTSANPRLRFVDPLSGGILEEDFDLVILSIGMMPRQNAEKLAALLHIGKNDEGFYRSARRDSGVFMAGACKGPRDIGSSILDAKAVAQQIVQYLGGI
jgi:heterodisulfide reductase subunit A